VSIFLPCILDRWTLDDASKSRSMSTWQDVRRDVIRNLEWLLNTEKPSMLAGRELNGLADKSVLAFGIPAYSGRAQSGFDSVEVAWAIRERIIAFETRLEHATLKVSVIEEGDRHRFNKMRFMVQGLLRSDPLPMEFVIQTELDTESGQARIVG